MPKSKRVQLTCHAPIAIDPNWKVPWDDVWVRFKGKPGRKVYTFGPCLCARGNLEDSLEWAKIGLERDKDMEPVDFLGTTITAEDTMRRHREEIERCEPMLERVRREGIVVAKEELSDPLIPNIYTDAEWIDQAEAERMITFYLNSEGFKGPFKFVWKRPRFFVHPT